MLVYFYFTSDVRKQYFHEWQLQQLNTFLLCFLCVGTVNHAIAQKQITPWRRPLDAVYVQLYLRYVVLFKVCWGTNQRQRHSDNGITVNMFHSSKSVDKQLNICWFHSKTYKTTLLFDVSSVTVRACSRNKTYLNGIKHGVINVIYYIIIYYV